MCYARKLLPGLLFAFFIGGQWVSPEFFEFVMRNQGWMGTLFMVAFFGSLINLMRG